jgi:ABC-type nitrate/sulfonate/bicarbonate transport system substrate-binding protein
MLHRRKLLRAGAISGLALIARNLPSASAQGGNGRPVNIVNTSGSTNLVLGQLLKQEGFFKEFGLDPKVVNVSDGNRVMGALISGEMDICPASGFSQVLPAIEKGAKIKVLGGGSLLPLQALLTKRPDIKTLKDLEGRTIGTGAPGSLLHQVTVALLRKYNVDLSKVTFANVGASPDVFRGVVAGTIDAGPVETWMEGKQGLRTIEHGQMYKELPQFVNQAAFTTEAAIANKRDALVRTLAAYARLYRFIMSPGSKEAFVKASAIALSKVDPEEATHQWEFFQFYKPFAAALVLNEAQINYMQDLNISLGLQRARLPFNQVADMSLAQDAVKLLG